MALLINKVSLYYLISYVIQVYKSGPGGFNVVKSTKLCSLTAVYVAGSLQASLTDQYHLTTLKALETTDPHVFG